MEILAANQHDLALLIAVDYLAGAVDQLGVTRVEWVLYERLVVFSPSRGQTGQTVQALVGDIHHEIR